MGNWAALFLFFSLRKLFSVEGVWVSGQVYFSRCAAADQMMGTVLDAFQQHGDLDNTYILFIAGKHCLGRCRVAMVAQTSSGRSDLSLFALAVAQTTARTTQSIA